MPTKINNVNFYSVADLSQKLNVTTASVRNYLRQRHLKGQKIMDRWFISEDDLNDFLENSKRADR